MCVFLFLSACVFYSLSFEEILFSLLYACLCVFFFATCLQCGPLFNYFVTFFSLHRQVFLYTSMMCALFIPNIKIIINTTTAAILKVFCLSLSFFVVFLVLSTVKANHPVYAFITFLTFIQPAVKKNPEG